MDETNRASHVRYLNNMEAAAFLKLSPHTLNKKRVTGGGPKFRKLGARVVYAIEDLEAWSQSRACQTTSDPQYARLR